MSVRMVDADNGWAVGHIASDMAILNWNGSGWNEIAAPGLGTLYSVFLFNATDGWAVGEFDIVRLVPPGE
jgi:hypothetical protein